nr:integrase, catalytic region, zinc finger, CCHC-type, peptidase aspartic, catalytic [Tanacetum cinerariifolium]
MLDRTDFASWQQRIRLYFQGKENGVNILKSIDEGPFQMGTVRESLAEGTEGAPNLGPERPRDIYTLINHYTDAKDIWDNVKMLLEGSELTKEDWESQLYDDFEHFRQHKGETIHDYYVRFAKLINDIRNIKMTMSRMQLNSKFVNNMLPEWGRFMTTVKLNRGLRDSNYDQLAHSKELHSIQASIELRLLERQDVANASSREWDGIGRRATIVSYLALTVDNVFQADECDAFDSDVDEAPMAQTMFMANLSSADPVNDNAGPSYDSDILSEYVKDNAVPVVHGNVSSVPNDAYMMIYNDMYEPHAQSVSKTSWNTVVENLLTAELATYKEQVELYKRPAMFELIERE